MATVIFCAIEDEDVPLSPITYMRIKIDSLEIFGYSPKFRHIDKWVNPIESMISSAVINAGFKYHLVRINLKSSK